MKIDEINENIKVEYITKFLLDCFDYYFNKIKNIPEIDLIKLKEVLKYYKDYLFESKKNDINNIDNIINNNIFNYEDYLKDYDKAKEMNIKSPIIIY